MAPAWIVLGVTGMWSGVGQEAFSGLVYTLYFSPDRCRNTLCSHDIISKEVSHDLARSLIFVKKHKKLKAQFLHRPGMGHFKVKNKTPMHWCHPESLAQKWEHEMVQVQQPQAFDCVNSALVPSR